MQTILFLLLKAIAILVMMAWTISILLVALAYIISPKNPEEPDYLARVERLKAQIASMPGAIPLPVPSMIYSGGPQGWRGGNAHQRRIMRRRLARLDDRASKLGNA